MSIKKIQLFGVIGVLLIKISIAQAEIPHFIPDEIKSYQEAAHVSLNMSLVTGDVDKFEVYRRLLKYYLSEERRNYEKIIEIYGMQASILFSLEDYENLKHLEIDILSTVPDEGKNIVESFYYRKKLQEGKYEEVLAFAERRIKQYPDRPFGYYYKSILLFLMEKNYAENKKICDFILKKSPYSLQFLIFGGFSSLRLGDYDEAIKQFDDYIRGEKVFDMYSSLPHYYKAMALYHKGDIAGAKKSIRKGRKINKVDISALSNRNDAIFKKKIESEIAELEHKMERS